MLKFEGAQNVEIFEFTRGNWLLFWGEISHWNLGYQVENKSVFVHEFKMLTLICLGVQSFISMGIGMMDCSYHDP